MARTFLTEKEINEMAAKVAASNQTSLEDWMAGEGWAEWMNEFTDAPDGEECTEKELDNIKKAQRKIWDKAQSMSE